MNLTITEHPEHEYRYTITVGTGSRSGTDAMMADQITSWLWNEYRAEKWVRTENARFIVVEHWLVMAIKMRFG